MSDTLQDRFSRHLIVPEEFWDCWGWDGYRLPTGYARIKVRGGMEYIHRVSWFLTNGPIPSGMQIDHLCHNTSTDCPGGRSCLHRTCTNPEHLDLVTQKENLLRSTLTLTTTWAARTHCDHGHPFTKENTYLYPNGTRRCKECRRSYDRENRSR